MKLCIPIENNEGVNSLVYGHFGSAPFFLIYDTETQTHDAIPNAGAHHVHGMCNPLNALQNLTIDAVVCRGMGMRAILKLQEAQIRAFRTDDLTVQDVIAALENNTLAEMTIENACKDHHCHG